MLAGHPVTAADEQSRLDDVLASSSLRMLQAGFWSVGPGTRDSAFVSACLGGVDAPGRLAPMPGEAARAVSNVYLYQPDADRAPEVGELMTVMTVTVGEGFESGLDWFIRLIGDDDTAGCRRDEFLLARANDPGSSGIDATVAADSTPDLGIGDSSARLDMRIVFSRRGDRQPVTYSYFVSRLGRTLVVLRAAWFGAGPFSGLDPQSELGAIVRELALS